MQSLLALLKFLDHSSLLVSQGLSLQSLVLHGGGGLLEEALLSPLPLLDLHRIPSLLLQASGTHGGSSRRFDGTLALLLVGFGLAFVLLLHDLLLASTGLLRELPLLVLDLLCVLLDRQELLILIICGIVGANLRFLLLPEHVAIAGGRRAQLLLSAISLRAQLLVDDHSTFALRLLLIRVSWAKRVLRLLPELPRALLLRLVAVLPLVFINIL